MKSTPKISKETILKIEKDYPQGVAAKGSRQAACLLIGKLLRSKDDSSLSKMGVDQKTAKEAVEEFEKNNHVKQKSRSLHQPYLQSHPEVTS